jgi:glycosyltransferase involved in cell wall biosynthesis
LFQKLDLDNVEYVVFSRKAGIDLKLLFSIRRFLKKNEIDIVHGHNLYPLVYGGYAAKLLSNHPKMVYTEQNQIYSASKRDRWGFKLYIRNADITIAVSEDLKEYLKETIKVKGDIRVVHNSTDGSKFKNIDNSGVRKEFHIEEGELVIGTAVVISRQKAIHVMIDAFARVCSNVKNIKLIIAGGGPLHEEMMAYAAKLGLSQKITFTGYRDDIPDLLSLYDIFLLSSIHEGHPLCLSEALAAGLPIVTTNVGGCPEIVIDNENGFVVPKDDSETFADRLDQLIKDANLRKKMSEANVKRFWEHFSVEDMVSKHERIYSELYDQIMRKE